MANVRYYGFIDPSGGRQDSFALAICHSEKDGKVVLDVSEETRAPFRPEAVVEEYSKTFKAYRITEVTSDRYAGEWVSASFKSHNITIKPSALTKSELYLEMLPMLQNGTVNLLDVPVLIHQIKALDRRAKPSGKDTVDNFHGRDDSANAAAGALVVARREAEDDAGPSWTYHGGMAGVHEVDEKDRTPEDSASWVLGPGQPIPEKTEDIKARIIAEVEKQAREMFEKFGYASPFRIGRDVGISFGAAKDYLFELGWVEYRKNQFVPKGKIDKI